MIPEVGRMKGYHSKRQNKKVDYETTYYHCSRETYQDEDGKKRKCELCWFTEQEIDAQVLEQIDFLEFDGELWQEIKKKLFEVEGEQVLGYEIRQLKAEDSRLDNDLERLYEDYKNSDVDEKFFISKQSKVRARQEEIKGRL